MYLIGITLSKFHNNKYNSSHIIRVVLHVNEMKSIIGSLDEKQMMFALPPLSTIQLKNNLHMIFRQKEEE